MATLIALFITSLASAAPVRNTTQTNLTHEPPFVPEPKGRGTIRLLSSCVLTLVICVWTAIHPNIIRKPTTRRRLTHKALYVILGLFSPEIVLAIAFNEWRAARKLLHEARNAGVVAYAQHEIEESEEAMHQAVKLGGNISQAAQERINLAGDQVRDAMRGVTDVQDRVRDAMKGVTEVQASNAMQVESLAAERKLRTALRQYKTALKNLPAYRRLIQNWIETLRGNKVGSFLLPEKASVHEFSWECSFFAVMKGYTFSLLEDTSELRPSEPASEKQDSSELRISRLDSSESVSSRLDSSRSAEEFTLSTEALVFLLQKSIISITDLAKLQNEVTDKGKSNMLAKLLVCIQAVWMVVNCLARKVAGLPITLLELNVVMHVVCAVTMYGFWWMKPLDAGRPISLTSRFSNSIGARELVYTMAKNSSHTHASSEVPTPISANLRLKTVRPSARGPSQGVPTASAPKGHSIEDQHGELIHMAPHDFGIRDTPGQALRRRVIYDRGQNPSDVSNSTDLIPKNTIWFLIPLCLIYGGIHASAWNSHFPTPIERLLWRVSCAIVAVPGFGTIAVWFFEKLYNRRKSFRDAMKYLFKETEHFLKDFLVFCGKLFLGLLILGIAGGCVYGIVSGVKHISRNMLLAAIEEISSAIVAVCVIGVAGAVFIARSISKDKLYVLIAVPLTVTYCAARVYIVVESFICLRSLPYGAFETISWDDVWPHL